MRKLSFWLLAALSTASAALSQVQIKLQISRTDSVGDTQIAYFGVDERATDCLDTSLGEREIWWQACGLVPCLAFINVRDDLGYCLGSGTTLDLRPFYGTSQADTYRLKFDGYPPIVFHWQSDIGLHYGSMTFMNSQDTNAATYKVNMMALDSFEIPRSELGRSQWYIIAQSPTPITGVHDSHLPTTTALSQNYPNPFNPSTVIGFALNHEAIVTITVYDILGRVVSVVTKNQNFNPGLHDLEFNADNLPSGIYFCQMISRNASSRALEYVAVKKMIVCK